VKKPGSGSKEPNRQKVGKITEKQLKELAALKIQDTNTTSLDSAISMLRGTARSMGIDVVDG
jgi:large subunit ribosomal protein L11